MQYNIAIIKGDGIGPEIVTQAQKVIKKIGEVYNHKFNFKNLLAGGCAIDDCGECLPENTIKEAKNSDAVLLGAVGGPKWDNEPSNNRPEKALLGLRSALGLFCNLRPAKVYKELLYSSPLKKNIIEGVDIIVYRELTSGIYFGKKETAQDGKSAYDIMSYTEDEIISIARLAFNSARERKKHVTLIDKSNVLETSKLWRKVVKNISKDYSDVKLDFMYVDNASMQLIKNPKQFDIILTENMFGDILSDELSMITGSIGLLPSASIRSDKFGMYEPIHGSAPDIADKNIANPIATILSVSMMLRYSFGLEKEAVAVENAVLKTIEDGFRTPDIYIENINTRKLFGFIKYKSAYKNTKKVGTIEITDEILRRIK